MLWTKEGLGVNKDERRWPTSLHHGNKVLEDSSSVVQNKAVNITLSSEQ